MTWSLHWIDDLIGNTANIGGAGYLVPRFFQHLLLTFGCRIEGFFDRLFARASCGDRILKNVEELRVFWQMPIIVMHMGHGASEALVVGVEFLPLGTIDNRL